MILRDLAASLSDRARLFLLAFLCFAVALLLSVWLSGWWATSIVILPGLLAFLQITKGVWSPEGGGGSKIGLASLGVALIAVGSGQIWRPSVNTLLGPIYEIFPQLKDKLPTETPSVIALLFLVTVILIANYFGRDKTAMKEHPTPIEREFPEKRYKQILDSFCGVLLRDLNDIDLETNWSSEIFTPLEAEVEIKSGSRRLKKITDLLKAIRSDRTSRVFLVLGDPGSGKSVALRKLCRELLSEVKVSGRVPLYINLREWEAASQWSETSPPTVEDLYAFVLSNLKSRGDVFANDFLDKYFKKMFENGRLFFVLDSFDEIPAVMDVSENSWLIDRLSEVIYKFLAGAHESRGILASRIFRRPTAKFDARAVLEIRPFTDMQIADFLKKSLFYDESLVHSLFSQRSHLVPIARNPFTAALISSYAKDHNNQLPDSQEELYSSYVSQRLNASIDRIEEKGLSQQDVVVTAVEIADIMLTTETLGLEASLSSLQRTVPNRQIADVVDILKYARLGRLGSTADRRFSFVHRRFNEYFVVQRLKQRPDAVPRSSIPTDSRWRDALVLYCEVAEETEARKIAEYCWGEIRQIGNPDLALQAPQYLRSVHSLRFLKEAFRARRSSIESFKVELAEFIITQIETGNLLLQKLAVEAVGLLDPSDIERALEAALEVNNQWINETALKSCNYLPRLGQDLTRKLRLGLDDIGLIEFFKRRREILFSLRLSNIFAELRRFCHWRTLDFYSVLLGVLLGMIVSPQSVLLALFTGFGASLIVTAFVTSRSSPEQQQLVVKLNRMLEKRTVIGATLIFMLIAPYVLSPFSHYATSSRYSFYMDLVVIAAVTPWYRLFYFAIPQLPALRLRHLKAVGTLLVSYAVLAGVLYLLYLLIPYKWGIALLTVVVVGGALLVVGMIGIQLVAWILDVRLVRRLPKRSSIDRLQIAVEFGALKTRGGRFTYVKYLRDQDVKPHGSWPKGIPNFGNDGASTLLAQLEEKWLGLDR